MKFVWQVARALSVFCILAAVGWNITAASNGDEQASQLLRSFAQTAGFMLPLWLLWKLAAYSHKRLRSDVS